MLSKEPVLVTGIGIVSSLGTDNDVVWSSLLSGNNGIISLDNYPSLVGYGVNVAGLVEDISLRRFKVKSRKKLSRDLNTQTRMLVYSGLSALDDAGVRYPDETERYRVGAIVGVGTALADEFYGQSYKERNPKWFLKTYPNLPLSYLSLFASLKGFCTNIVSSCCSGSQSIGQAYQMIRHNQADILIAGGVEDKVSPPFFSGFSRLNMSTTEDDPDRAMRPFDKSRCGFVIGKGACVLVLESRRHAEKRNATVKGRVVGYGASMNKSSLTDASMEGIANSMQNALTDAHLVPEDIQYINGHGTATISNDREESFAIKKVFGQRAYYIPINSTKSMIGHTFAACGAIEAAVCINSLCSQRVHPTRNFIQGDAYCDLDYVKGKSRQVEISYCMSNNSGIGGYNTSLIFGKA